MKESKEFDGNVYNQLLNDIDYDQIINSLQSDFPEVASIENDVVVLDARNYLV